MITLLYSGFPPKFFAECMSFTFFARINILAALDNVDNSQHGIPALAHLAAKQQKGPRCGAFALKFFDAD